MNKRRDKKGRILHYGEYQMPDGRYRFKYVDSFGKSISIYSHRLDCHDPYPEGKKNSFSISRQIVTMIKVLFVCHGRINVSVDKLCNSTISHDTV